MALRSSHKWIASRLFGWFVGLRILRSIASSRVDWFLPPVCAFDGVVLAVAIREVGLPLT